MSLRPLGLCFFLCSIGISWGQIQPAARVNAEINDNDTYKLSGNTKPMLGRALDMGEVSAGFALPRVTMHLAMTVQQHEDLEQLLRQQQTRGAAQFHKFLTPEQYGARFGANLQDMAKIRAWLEWEGFTDIEFGRSRTFITFSGTTTQAQTAFHTAIHRYELNGERHYANASDPLLPQAIEGTVESIQGLHDFRMKPRGRRRARPRYVAGGSHYLAPSDVARIYNVNPLYQTGFDGSGVKIAVVGQSDILLSDIEAFRRAAGLTQNDPTIVVVGQDPGRLTNTGDETESDLDVELSGAVAKNASIIFVESANVTDATSYAIDNNVAPILSTSYGQCELYMGRAATSTLATELQQANAQGMTVLAASGDEGAADCDSSAPVTNGPAVDEPASFPNVTGVGGTTLSDGSGSNWNTAGSAISYIPEVVWNGSSAANGLSASGGGASIYNPKPAWQTGLGVPVDGARDVPDIALAADPDHDGFLICGDGSCTNGFKDSGGSLNVIGGTSCGAPTFAGIVALMVEAWGAQGNINPNLYALAASAPYVFHDVTTGNNIQKCIAGSKGCDNGSFGFSAGPGYDQTTGWGSVDAYQLINEWSSNNVPAGVSKGPLRYVPVIPCRVLDTRNSDGLFGGPELAANATREFAIPQSECGIPASAEAYALNVTVVPRASLNYLSIWPTGQAKPLVSTLNSDGRVKANAAIVPAGINGGVSVYATDPTQVIMDISGYFVAGSGTSDLEFFPLTPCRIADTRGGASLVGGQSRAFDISGNCNVPSSATAYSLNFTAVPPEELVFFTAWPTGQTQPATSILNASPGSVTANAAIVTAGSGGSITTYATDNTDMVIDINGYFGAAATGGLSLYTLTPCRVIDTRNPAGSTPFSGTIAVAVTSSGCDSPTSAQAYVLNATVVPMGILGYLSLWPEGATQPLVSTLNADLNTVTSNMAIVPTTNGAIDAFAVSTTYLILDISGYFAP